MSYVVHFEWPFGGQEGQEPSYLICQDTLEGAKLEAALLYATLPFAPKSPTAYTITGAAEEVVYCFPDGPLDPRRPI